MYIVSNDLKVGILCNILTDFLPKVAVAEIVRVCSRVLVLLTTGKPDSYLCYMAAVH